jgi:hypothetical protein
MQLFLCAQTMFGILFVLRTLQVFRARALLTSSVVTKSGTVFVCSELLGAFFCAHRPVFALLISCTNIFCSFATLILLERRQIDALKSEFPFFLDRWILNLRLGWALAPARDRAVSENSERFRALMLPLWAHAGADVARLNHLLLPNAVLGELQRLQREPHASLSRLENLRRTLRKAADFRRKSGQAVRQTRLQSTLLLLMLFALIAFTLRRYRWSQVSDLITGSAVLSAIGVLMMGRLAEKTRWKI